MCVPGVSTVLLETSVLITMHLLSKVPLFYPQYLIVYNFICYLNSVKGVLSENPGALFGDRVRCPFHGACFNVTTGDIEEYPGLDCLPTYKVEPVCKDQHSVTLNFFLHYLI